eukprot:scaffold75915_cov55-Prasinocladus_malaysianus.AAC.1
MKAVEKFKAWARNTSFTGRPSEEVAENRISQRNRDSRPGTGDRQVSYRTASRPNSGKQPASSSKSKVSLFHYTWANLTSVSCLPSISCHYRCRQTIMEPKDFFTEYGEANRYTIKEVIGKGSYGVVCSATDNLTGET